MDTENLYNLRRERSLSSSDSSDESNKLGDFELDGDSLKVLCSADNTSLVNAEKFDHHEQPVHDTPAGSTKDPYVLDSPAYFNNYNILRMRLDRRRLLLNKMTTKEYLDKLLRKSLVTGVPEIAKSSSCFRKWIRSVIIIGCFLGFAYQCVDLWKEMVKYPSNVDVKLTFPGKRELPAISFCNTNQLKRQPFCKRYPEKCIMPKNVEHFCRQYPYFCLDSDPYLRFPTAQVMNQLVTTREDLKEFGHKAIDMIKFCVVYDDNSPRFCNLTDALYILVPTNQGFQNCYSLFSQLNPAIAKKYEVVLNRVNGIILELVLTFQAQEYFRPDMEVSGSVFIHSPYEMREPFYYGIRIKPGREYLFHIKSKEEFLLPYPYESNCTDYQALEIARGRKSPRTVQSCFHECLYNVSLKHCGCVNAYSMYLHNDTYCTENDFDSNNVSCHYYGYSECLNKCKQPCHSTTFEYSFTIQKSLQANFTNIEDFYNSHEPSETLDAVLIFRMEPEVFVYRHTPQFNSFEIFGYVGGYIGIWLGISLIAVFDFLETIFHVLKFWILKNVPEKICKSQSEEN